jgi:hypothetical protein
MLALGSHAKLCQGIEQILDWPFMHSCSAVQAKYAMGESNKCRQESYAGSTIGNIEITARDRNPSGTTDDVDGMSGMIRTQFDAQCPERIEHDHSIFTFKYAGE